MKNEFILNNREVATLFWFLVLVVSSLKHKSVWDSIFTLAKGFLDWRILLIFTVTFTYIFGTIYLLKEGNIWEIYLTKPTIYWLFGTAILMLMNSNKAIYDREHYKKLLFSSFQFILVIQFFVNLYTFPLVIELVLVPTVFFIVGIMTVSKYSQVKSSELVKKVLERVLGVIGLILVFYFTYRLYLDPDSFFSIRNLKEFTVPLMLTLLLMPFLFLLSSLMAFESNWRRKKKL